MAYSKKTLLGMLGIAGLLLSSCAQPSSSTGASSSTSTSSSSAVLDEKGLTDDILDDEYRNYYEIFVYSYADSDGDGIGDLNGITQKLSYIRSLGFTGIWLTPIFESPTYHKYNATDYFTVDSQFGTNDDLKTLVDTAHDDGIKVILDLALNHSSTENEWFQESVNAFAKEELGGFSLTDEEKEEASLYSLSTSAATFADDGKGYQTYSTQYGNVYYECNFGSGSDMPEFNFDSSYTWEKFESIIAYWEQDYAVDGFRLDAVKYYYLDDTADNITALSKIKSLADEYSLDGKAYVVGECWDSQGVIEKYYESTMDSYFWFPGQGSTGFIIASTNNTGTNNKALATGQAAMGEASGSNISAPFLDNHDTSRFSGANASTNKFRYGLLSTLSGNTFTYYGDEIGINGSGDSDANYRTYMDWGDGMETNGAPNGTATYPFGSVADQQDDPDSILNYVKKANEIRNALPGIARGSQASYEKIGKRGLVIDKTYTGQDIQIVYNYSDTDNLDFTPDSGYEFYYALTASKADNDSGIYGGVAEGEDGSYVIPPLGIGYFVD